MLNPSAAGARVGPAWREFHDFRSTGHIMWADFERILLRVVRRRHFGNKEKTALSNCYSFICTSLPALAVRFCASQAVLLFPSPLVVSLTQPRNCQRFGCSDAHSSSIHEAHSSIHDPSYVARLSPNIRHAGDEVMQGRSGGIVFVGN